MLIAENWEEMLRVAASLKYGHVTASLIVGKLSRADRQNTLAAALKEYGRCVVPSTPPATWPGRTTAARSPASSTRARACTRCAGTCSTPTKAPYHSMKPVRFWTCWTLADWPPSGPRGV